MTPAKSDRTESAVSRGEGADRNRTGVPDRSTVPAGTRVDVAALRGPWAPPAALVTERERNALLDVAEAAEANAKTWRRYGYGDNHVPDAVALDEALAWLDFGDGA